ncbi:MAG: hypothetical protein ABI886_00790 [Betaproteobacteria bacterium]
MNKIAAMLILAFATASLAGAAVAQRGGGGHSGGSSSGSSHGSSGGSWHGGSSSSGSWHGNSSSNGYRHGGYAGGYYGRGYYGRGWYGGWWGPSVGVYFGGPGYWGGWADPWYYGYPYAYGYPYGGAPASVYVAPDAATTYVEPAPAPPAIAAPQSPAAPPTLWFYCTDPAGYYPYVQSCTNAWMSVDPKTVRPSS